MESPSTCSTKNRGFKPVPVEKAQTKVSKMQANGTMPFFVLRVLLLLID